jgi:GT2 family glycosyltransferase
MQRVIISVVLYKNTYKSIEELLRSIVKFSEDYVEKYQVKTKIYDGSRNGIINSIKNNLGNQFELEEGENIGYGKANNRNLLKESSDPDDIYIISNPDIRFNSDQIDKIIVWFNNNKYTCISPLIINQRKEIQYTAKKNPTILSLLVGRLKILRKIKIFREYDTKNKNMSRSYEEEIIECDYLSGCFMVTKAQYFKEVSGFDERYFLHLEDADLTRKMRQIGRTAHCPIGIVEHKWERGSHKSIKQMFLLSKSMLQYFGKWGFKIK